MPKKTTELSTEAYKGVRDFYPPDMAIQEYIFDVWKKIAESFGYEEYGASVLEPAELFRTKTSEEIVNQQTYTFVDRGGREVTMRPEITPSVARMIAAKKRELVFPVRWYSIPNLYRYEQPQRGRVREFWQFNADIFGVDSVDADIETISLAYKIVKGFGAQDENFEIKVNNRNLLRKIFDGKLRDAADLSAAIRLLDRRSKMKPAEFEQEMAKLVTSAIDFNITADKEMLALIEALENQGIKNVKFDATLARGFDYYTGMIFEIFDTNPANRRALFGGGRYDDLTSLFGEDKVSAVGFGIGDVTMRDFLDIHGLLPTTKISADYYICVISPTEAGFAQKIAQNLRDKGSRVAIDFTYKKIGDQIKSADKRGIQNVIVIGDEEAKTGHYKIKNLKTGEEIPDAKLNIK